MLYMNSRKSRIMARVTVRLWHPINIRNPSYQSVEPATRASIDAQKLSHIVFRILFQSNLETLIIGISKKCYRIPSLQDSILRIHQRTIRLYAYLPRSLASRELVHLTWKAILIGRSTERCVPHGAQLECQDPVVDDA